MEIIHRSWLYILLLFILKVERIYAQPTGPILKLETGMHSARSNSISSDVQGRYLLSCGADKTARLWDAPTGKLLNTLRIPIGDEEEGIMYACALSSVYGMAAIGGWTGSWEKTDCIYLLNPFTGIILNRLCNLPNVVNCLEFSKDGKWLAAGLGKSGVRVYNTNTWEVIELSGGYSERVTGLSFNNQEQLATVGYDGYLRLYDLPDFSLATEAKMQAGKKLFSVAFNPDGSLIAVGYDDNPLVEIFKTTGLQIAYIPDVSNIPINQDVSSVSFSSDGNSLYAGGTFTKEDTDGANKYVVRKWNNAGKGAYEDIPMLNNTVVGIRPLPDGKMVVLGTNPDIAGLDVNGNTRWHKTAANINFATHNPVDLTLSVAGDAIRLNSSYGKELFFRLNNRSLYEDNSICYSPVTENARLQLSGWRGSISPTINHIPLAFLSDNETCRSACISSDGTKIAWGGDYSLYLTDNAGKLIWKKNLTEVAFAVNISGSGKVITVTQGDGTIRWYNLLTGKEVLSLYVTDDRQRWLLFTPKGYYDASPGAEDLLGWHVNNGPDKAPAFFPASRFKHIYYRPDIIDAAVENWDEQIAISVANNIHRRKTRIQTISNDKLPPTIVINSPNSGTSVSSEIVSINYSLHSPDNAPVSHIKVMVDGRPVAVPRGIKLPQKKSHSLQVNIPKKSCTVTLIAENSNGISPEANLYLKYNSVEQGQNVIEKKSNLFILAIGISNYNNPDYNLNYAAEDARGFVDVFNKQRDLQYAEVVTKCLIDKDATREKIEMELEWIEKQTSDKDVAMIFFAGHGINDNNGIFYMAPVGGDVKNLRSTCLNFTELTQTVAGIVGKVVVFIDACHSGNVTGGKNSSGDINGAINELASSQNGAVVFTSSMGREYSFEDADWKHGAFTKALLDGIGRGEALKKGKNTISIKSLDLYISGKVEELTKGRQHPTTVVPPNVPDFTIAILN